MSPKTAFLFLVPILFVSGCRETTFKPPTADTPLKRIESDLDVDTQAIFSKSVSEFTRKNLATIEGQWSPAGTFLNGLVLLNASSGDTYKEITQSLNFEQPDYSPLNQGANNWLIDQDDKNNLSISNGIFMVWPYKLEKPFVKRMAQSFAVDLIKFGSPSQTSQQAIDAWCKSKGFEGEALYRPFVKANDKMMSLSICSFALPWPGSAKNGEFVASARATAVAGHFESAVVDLNDQTEIILIIPSKDWKGAAPTPEEWSALMDPAKSGAKTVSFQLPSPGKTDVSSCLPPSLLTGPVDLRYMSLDLKDDCTMQQQWSRVTLQLDAKSDEIGAATGADQAKWFVIRDKAKRVVVVAGPCSP